MRINIRRLFVRSVQAFAVLLCVAITLWCVLPTYRLYRFEAAIAAGDFDTAAELEGVKGPEGRAWIEGASVERRAFTWDNVWRGEREFDIVVPAKDSAGNIRPQRVNRRTTPFSITFNRC
jgi:hypothetical protein